MSTQPGQPRSSFDTDHYHFPTHVPTLDDVIAWSPSEVYDALVQMQALHVGLGHKDIFVQHNITGKSVLTMTQEHGWDLLRDALLPEERGNVWACVLKLQALQRERLSKVIEEVDDHMSSDACLIGQGKYESEL